MSNEGTPTGTPTAKPRVTGLGPKAQKLQALREKMAAQATGGGKQNFNTSASGAKGGPAAGHKKTNFQRKAT